LIRPHTRWLVVAVVVATAAVAAWAVLPRSDGGRDKADEARLARAGDLIRFGRLKDLDEAVALLRTNLAKRPNDFEARMLLGYSLLTSERIADAEPEFAECARLRPDRAEPLTGLAGCAVGRGEIDEAQKLLDQALALNPSFVQALADRGNIHLMKGRYDKALRDFRRVVQLDPGNKQGHLKLAQLYKRSGDDARARQHQEAYLAAVRAKG